MLASGRAEHAPGLVTAPLADGGSADGGAWRAGARRWRTCTRVPFFAGVLFTWRVPGEAEQVAEVLDHAQRLGSIGGWEEQFAAGTVRWTRDAFALFGLDPAQASPIPIAALHSFVIAADRAPVRRFQESLLQRREPAVAVFRIVRPGDTVIRQIRVFAEPVLAGDTLVALRGAFQDVSVQYHTQVALAATRDQLADSEQRAAEEHQLALRLQRAIMAQDEPPVAAAGVDVAVRYRPAEQGHLVGGDWYDVLPLPRRRPAARGGGHHRARHRRGDRHDRRAQRAARARRDRGGPGRAARPPQLRGLPPDRGHRRAPSSAAATSRRPGCSAGPGPGTCPRSWSATARAGRCRSPTASCSASTRTAQYEEASTQLRVGDTLLLFTDGLIERRSGSISDALRDFALAAAPAGPDARSHADRILSSALSDTGDDACLVVVRIQ